jgi:hypothetical protein
VAESDLLCRFLLLTGLEIHNLYRDRNERDKEQAIARKEERDAFKAIADGINKKENIRCLMFV